MKDHDGGIEEYCCRMPLSTINTAVEAVNTGLSEYIHRISGQEVQVFCRRFRGVEGLPARHH